MKRWQHVLISFCLMILGGFLGGYAYSSSDASAELWYFGGVMLIVGMLWFVIALSIEFIFTIAELIRSIFKK